MYIHARTCILFASFDSFFCSTVRRFSIQFPSGTKFWARTPLVGGVEKVYSPCDGKVSKLSRDTGGGGYIMYIDIFEKIDGKNVRLVFMHLNPGTSTKLVGSSIQFGVGDIVKAGDYIADMGGTTLVGIDNENKAHTNAVHLHFQVEIYESTDWDSKLTVLNFGKWVPVNPLLYFNLRNFNFSNP